MKPLSEWDQSDLKSFIDNGIQESIVLDYKCSLALSRESAARTEISKDVSAFANSAGGMIIYGIIEEKHIPIRIDEGIDPNVLTREWLEQIINTIIRPRISGILIKQILLANGKVSYAINIPQANSFAPHMAVDNKYYKRFNFQSVPMEDYEVKDAIRRAMLPHPVLIFRQTSCDIAEDRTSNICVHIAATNMSAEPVLYATISIYIDRRLIKQEHANRRWLIGDFDLRQEFQAKTEVGTEIPILEFSANHSVPRHMPIFKEAKFKLSEIELCVAEDVQYYLGYRIQCPGYSFSSIVTVGIFNGQIKEITDQEESVLGLPRHRVGSAAPEAEEISP